MTTTKDDTVKSLTKENGFQKKRAIEIVENLLELIKCRLASGDDVLISGLGKFCVNEKRETRGRNPASGEDMMLAPRRVVTFKCSGLLQDKINQQEDI